MKWQKQGLIITPQKKLWWMQTHAMLPTVLFIEKDVYRIYFSGRDKKNRSHIGYSDIEIKNTSIKVLKYSQEPILNLGKLGCFDDNGVTPSWIINNKSKKYLYYIGWNKRSRVRMGLMIGLAISTDGGKTFTRYSKAPILERTDKEPYSILTAPCVLKENNLWKMWYVSCLGWKHEDLPLYHIKYAESKDGRNWKRKGIICIDFRSSQETALARPCVLDEKGIYKMWYSYKGKNYRIGYAESKDGINWKREDNQINIDVSKKNWDSQMIEYAYVFNHKDKKYMLYNGNDYGKLGIGYAVA